MTHHDLRPGQVLGDRYRLDRSLGSGSTGTVYAAEDLLLTRPVAVKVVDPDVVGDEQKADAVRRAGSLMASVAHPGLATVYDATRLDDRFCIVMELVSGPSLQTLIDDGGVSAQLVARVGAQASSALNRLHSMGHVHGNVSAANVLVAPIGSAKLVDVGLGSQVTDGAAAAEGDDVTGLAAALRAALADPDAPAAADLVDVLDAVASNGATWSAEQLADALNVIATGATPGPLPAVDDPDATAVLPPVQGSGPATTRVMRVADTDEIPVAAPEAARGAGTGSPRRPAAATSRPLRAAWFPRAMLVVAALAVIGVLATRTSGDNRTPDGGDGPPAGDPVAVQAASDFDPLGGGGEHGDEVPLAHDGDPATAWTTEGYEQPNLGGIKSGVGIWFDLGQSTAIGRIDLTMPVAGADFSVYALDDEPQGGDPAAWGEPVATGQGAAATENIDVPENGTGRYWLVWLTNLGPDGDGRYRGGVAEIAFVAR